jgi:hypothetical protein
MQKEDKKKLLERYKNRVLTGGIIAIKNSVNGRVLLEATLDIEGRQNRFNFVKSTGMPAELNIRNDWEKYGSGVFSFEVLEKLTKKDGQTKEEFAKDIEVLKELWLEKYRKEELY